MTDFRLGEMFCGPGGIGRGVQFANEERKSRESTSLIHHTWALDYHPDTVRTYKRNFPQVADENVFTADITKFDLRELPPFDAFAYGFPCNDFSIVGEKKGLGGKFGPLYSYGVHAIALNRPRWFLAENVTGISSTDGGAAFGQILDALEEPVRSSLADPNFTERYESELSGLDRDLKYDLVAHRYRFEDYGVPQARHRVLIVGIRQDIGLEFKVPAANHKIRTAGEAIGDPPIPEGAPNHEFTRHSEAVKNRLALIKPGMNAFNSDFTNDPEARLNVKGATLSHIYKRVDPDRPAYTVTGSGGGGTQMYHWEELRGLTNRERARLQTFPDDFIFEGGIQSVRRQIGMAVPPEGVVAIIRAVLDTFDKVKYASDEPSINSAEYIHRFRQVQDRLL